MMFKHIKYDIYGYEVPFEVELSLYLKLSFNELKIIHTRTKYILSQVGNGQCCSIYLHINILFITCRVHSDSIKRYIAAKECGKEGGHLVTLESASEEEFVTSLLDKSSSQYWTDGVRYRWTWKWRTTGELF